MNQLISKMSGVAMLLAAALPVQGQVSGSQARFGSGGVVTSAVKAPQRAATDGSGVTITGSVIFPDNMIGMWEFPTTGYTPKVLQRNIKANAGGFAANDGYYYVNWYENISGIEALMTKNYDMSTWEPYDEYTTQDMSCVATTIAYSPWRDAAYGCFYNTDRTGYVFAKWNYSYFRKDIEICPLERPWSACAFDSKSDLYAIEENGDLYRVDVSDGTMTKIGSTGVSSTFTSDGAIDPATDIFYWCVASDKENALYQVDLTSARATKLYDLAGGEQIAGMFIPEAAPSQDAPAKTSVSINLSSSSTALAIPLRFTLPRYTVAQAALGDEELEWTIYSNGKQVATGKGAKGTTVSETVTVDKPDYYCFTVVTKNAAGTSPKAQAKRFCGTDTPKAPSTVNMTVAGNKVTVSWGTVPSTGLHGGSVAYSTATFSVTRQPDGKVIATGLSNSSRKVEDEIEMPATRTDYYYEIQAEVGGVAAPVAKSGTVSFGPLRPAFELTFPATTAQAGWTMLDNNEDGTKWGYYSSYKSLYISGSKGFDDYAVTPPVEVEAGFTYPLSLSLRTNNYYEEEFEVLYGTSPDVASMTSVAVEPTKYKGTEFTTYTGNVRATATGRIYIAIHAKTATPSNSIYVEKIALGEGSNVMAPLAVTDLEFTLPRDGTVKASMTFKTPAANVEGAALTGDLAVNKVEVLRDGKSVFVKTGETAPATPVEFTDDAADLTIGEHTYTVLAYNTYGAGAATSSTVYVGPDKPAAPTSAKFVEDGNTGKVTISWAAVTTDAQGNTLLPGMVTYRVIDRDMNTIADKVTGTSFTYQAVPEGEQKFVQFAVYAVTAGGESATMAPTDYKCAGTPAMAPWKESFANKQISSPFGYNYLSGNEPWMIVSTTENGYLPQDGDGGFMYLEAYGGDNTALLTGKIDMSEIVSPALTYFSYNYRSSFKNTITVQVDNGDGNGFRDVQTDVIGEAGPEGQWNKIVVNLDEYALQTVMIRFVPGNIEGAFFTLDNLRIDSYLDYNLAARELEVPAVVDPGKEFEISFSAVNVGQKQIGNYSMQLWRGDEMVASQDFQNLAPDAVKKAVFTQTLDVPDGDGAEYHGVVSTRMDQNEADNASETLTVAVAHPVVPVPAALQGTQQGAHMVLTWTAPELSTAAPAPYTESFEGAQSWSQTITGWQNIDGDQIPMGGFNSNLFPLNGLCAWYVTDSDHEFVTSGTSPQMWDSHSGKKHIASSFVMRNNIAYQSDDWAITPRLYGGAQAVSLWAKSFYPDYLEDIELLYSSTTTSPEEFVSLGMAYELPTAWVQLRVMLPDGAKYFAIRSRSIDKHQLFVDDVTFIPADGAPATLDLKGYNVYRDGVKLNSTPVEAPTFTDEAFPADGAPDYFVTAVYANGESRASNHFTAAYDGIAAIDADGSLAVRVEGSEIVVTGAQAAVSVYSADGRLVATADAAPEVRFNALRGVYVVRSASAAVKVVVR